MSPDDEAKDMSCRQDEFLRAVAEVDAALAARSALPELVRPPPFDARIAEPRRIEVENRYAQAWVDYVAKRDAYLAGLERGSG